MPEKVSVQKKIGRVPLGRALPRILGSKNKLPSKLFKMAGYYLDTPEGRNEVAEKWPAFPMVYHEALGWLKHMLHEERLIISDINLLPGSLPALEVWMKKIRTRFPNDAIVLMGDNFAQYQLETPDPSDTARAKTKSKFIKRLANNFQACLFVTAELRECNENEQAIFRERAAAVTSRTAAAAINGSSAPNRSPF